MYFPEAEFKVELSGDTVEVVREGASSALVVGIPSRGRIGSHRLSACLSIS